MDITKQDIIRTLSRYSLLLFLGTIVFSLLVIRLGRAAGPALTIEDYWQQLQETKDLISGLTGASPQAQQARLLAEANLWAEVREVFLADGTMIPVNHSFLVSQLRADPPDLKRLEGLLTTLLAARDAFEPLSLEGSEMANLADILARAEFQWPEEDTRPSWLEQLWRHFLAWLDRLFPDGGEMIGRGSFPRYLLTVSGILILALTLAYVVRNLAINFVSEATIAQGDLAQGMPLTADSALSQAQTLAGVGDYRSAVRYLYLSALLSLEERGLLRYNRSLTNREYLRTVAHLPDLAAILREVVDVFDRVWYGYQPLDPTAYDQYEARVTELRRPRLSQSRVRQQK